jgi:hypothetical protein
MTLRVLLVGWLALVALVWWWLAVPLGVLAGWLVAFGVEGLRSWPVEPEGWRVVGGLLTFWAVSSGGKGIGRLVRAAWDDASTVNPLRHI